MAYEGMLKPELVELARGRGLAVSGTVEELLGRLDEWDAQHPPAEPDLLAALDTPEEPAGSPSEATEDPGGVDAPAEGSEGSGDQAEALPDAPPEAPTPAPAPADRPKVFTADYTIHGGYLEGGLHLQLLRQIVLDAEAAGHTVKGGARCVRVVGDTATYEVLLRRK